MFSNKKIRVFEVLTLKKITKRFSLTNDVVNFEQPMVKCNSEESKIISVSNTFSRNKRRSSSGFLQWNLLIGIPVLEIRTKFV